MAESTSNNTAIDNNERIIYKCNGGSVLMILRAVLIIIIVEHCSLAFIVVCSVVGRSPETFPPPMWGIICL